MRHRKLRITVSATCLIACVLLIALWVRSYSVRDRSICVISNQSILLQSVHGELGLFSNRWDSAPYAWHFGSDPNAPHVSLWKSEGLNDPGAKTRSWVFIGTGLAAKVLAAIPHWCAVVLTATLAAGPWLPWSRSFSLRTLLIATTLVALTLGGIMYFSTRPPAVPRFDQGFGR
jgi:hypothetical protein